MTSNILEIKKEMVEIVSTILNEKVQNYEKDIKDSQHEANQFKGAMESRYDTFKEELQERKKNLQIQQGKMFENISLLNSLKLVKHQTIGTGTVVKVIDEKKIETNYFFFANISTKPINVLGTDYFLLSIESPLGEIFKGKIIGDSVKFRNKTFKVIDLF